MTGRNNGARHELSLDLPAAHRGVRVARNMVHRFARMQGASSESADEMALVASELLANAIDHGGGAAALTEDDLDGDVRVRLRFELSATSWVLSVTDQGGGDAQELRSQLDSADFFDLEHDRGRGLFLLKAAVDLLEIEPSPDGDGLTFRATKRHDAGG